MGSIYKLINLKNNKAYVGSSKYFPSRKAVHLRLLRSGKHYNKHLQASFNKHGESSFHFEILEADILPENLIEREQHFIDILHPIYNKRLIAASNLGRRYTMSQEHKEKIGSSNRKLTNHEIVDIVMKVKSGMMLVEVGKIYGIHPAHISKIKNGHRYSNITGIKPKTNNYGMSNPA